MAGDRLARLSSDMLAALPGPVVARLEREPHAAGGPTDALELEGEFRGDRSMAGKNQMQFAGDDIKLARGLGDGQAEGFEAEFAEEEAGVGRVCANVVDSLGEFGSRYGTADGVHAICHGSRPLPHHRRRCRGTGRQDATWPRC